MKIVRTTLLVVCMSTGAILAAPQTAQEWFEFYAQQAEAKGFILNRTTLLENLQEDIAADGQKDRDWGGQGKVNERVFAQCAVKDALELCLKFQYQPHEMRVRDLGERYTALIRKPNAAHFPLPASHKKHIVEDEEVVAWYTNQWVKLHEPQDVTPKVIRPWLPRADEVAWIEGLAENKDKK